MSIHGYQQKSQLQLKMAGRYIERPLDYSWEVVEAAPECNVRLIVNRESIDWSPSDDPAGENGP